MSMTAGIILCTAEVSRADSLVKNIENKRRFSDTVNAEWRLNERSLALIGLDPSHLHYAALALRGKRVATLKVHVEFTDFVELHSLALQELEEELRSSIRPYIAKATSGQGQLVPPETLAATLEAIRKLRPYVSSDIDRLERLAEARRREPMDPRREQLAEEKDALLLARQIFGLDSRRDPLAWQDYEHERIPSFLAGVNAARVTEDILIQHDHQAFGAWQLISRYQVGAVQFAREKETLTVVTANKAPLEQSLGVDLIYWHHRYNAFTMVQYKRMTKEGRLKKKAAVYRPSGSYEKELRQMKAVWSMMTSAQNAPYSSCTEYRLTKNPFFFKLCHLSEFDPGDQSLVPGMYIPLDYWDTLLASDRVVGPKGGKAVTYENVERYLNNTEFTLLVQSGWVGSCGIASAQLEKIVAQTLAGGRAVEFAWSQGKHSRPSPSHGTFGDQIGMLAWDEGNDR